MASERPMEDDQRYQRLEQQLATRSMGHERMLKQMTKFIQVNQPCDEASTSQQSDAHQMGIKNQIEGFLPHLDFPIYDGDTDPTVWICRAEQYFDFQNVGVAEKVRLASYYLKGDAQIWIQRKKSLHE